MATAHSGDHRPFPCQYGDGHGCTDETFLAGTSWVHPASTHDIANDGDEPTVVHLTCFLPEGATPALIPADPPRGC